MFTIYLSVIKQRKNNGLHSRKTFFTATHFLYPVWFLYMQVRTLGAQSIMPVVGKPCFTYGRGSHLLRGGPENEINISDAMWLTVRRVLVSVQRPFILLNPR